MSSRTGLDLMKEMVVSILVDIIREEMKEVVSSGLRESLLDDVDKFRATIVKRMLADEARNPKDTFKVERLPSAFQEAWKAWKTGHAQCDEMREEVSYRAFQDVLEFKSPVDKDV